VTGRGGTLCIVGTPIGNLEDVSRRAERALSEADAVLAEDTRRTRALLTHLGIDSRKLERFDAEAEARASGTMVERLAAGERIALVSDAGMPAISDPGASLVAAALAAGVRVTVVPGPSAVTSALAVSGMPASRFRFFGFLDRGGSGRREQLAELASTRETAVLFEAPSRLGSTLRELAQRMPSRPAAVVRELTKMHEEQLRGSLAELASERLELRGEIVVLLAPWQPPASAMSDAELDARIDELLADGMRVRDAARALSLESDLSARELYRRISARRDSKR
jgi:16S rRNA (cytidine1402-2'-O)-methyltransferase